jgi:hypothetical protein
MISFAYKSSKEKTTAKVQNNLNRKKGRLPMPSLKIFKDQKKKLKKKMLCRT